MCWKPRAPWPLIQSIKRCHVILVELEPENVGILSDAVRPRTLWQRHPAFLQGVPHQHLSRRLVVLGRHDEKRSVVEARPRGERAIRLQHYAVGPAVGDQFALLAPGVKLGRSVSNMSCLVRM